MSIVNTAPALLAEAKEPIPLYVQYCYAFWTLRSILGRGRYDTAEDRIVLDIYRQEAQQAGQEAIVRRAEDDADAPRIRAHFLQEVNKVLDNLLPDGSCRIRTRKGGLVWTASPEKIARELNVLPQHVRAAQAQLKQKKGA